MTDRSPNHIPSPSRGRARPRGGPAVTARARRGSLALIALIAATVGSLALSDAPALAVRGHVFTGTFGKEVNATKVKEKEEGKSVSEAEEDVCTVASGDECQGGQPGSGAGQLEGPMGIAVNETTHDVYVVDSMNNRVERFSQEGEYLSEFNGSGLEGEGERAGSGGKPGEIDTGEFSHPAAIAVDNSCALHRPALTGTECEESDPSAGDVYVVAARDPTRQMVVDKFSATGEYVGQITEVCSEVGVGCSPKSRYKPYYIYGVGVAPNGRVYVSNEAFIDQADSESSPKLVEYYSDGVPNELQGAAVSLANSLHFSFGLAVDGKGDVYSSIETSPIKVQEFGPLGETLVSQFGSELAEWEAIEFPSEDVYVVQTTSVGRYAPGGEELEQAGEGHFAERWFGLTLEAIRGGVAVDSSTKTVYVSDRDESVDELRGPVTPNAVVVLGPEPPGRPSVEEESFGDVTSTGAALSGRINPHSEPSEAPTSYRIEYGRCATLAACPASEYEHRVEGSLPPDYEPHALATELVGLEPSADYHFRIVAGNAHGESVGEERTFVTQPVGGTFTLPDDRQWELVSSVDKHGADIEAIGESGVVQAAADGDALTYLTTLPTEPEPPGYAVTEQAMSVRGTAGGWSSRDIGLTHDTPAGVPAGVGQEYRFFSADLGQAVVESLGVFSAPEAGETFPETSERTPYVRHDTSCREAPSTCFEPLATSAPECGDVPPGEHFGGPPHEEQGEVTFVGATPDGEHVILSSRTALTAARAPHGGLYEWSAQAPCTERLRLVSLLPGSSEGVKARLGGRIAGTTETESRHAISDDGSRVYFGVEGVGESLYVREGIGSEDERTVALPGERFQGASADGSRAFVRSGDGALTEFDLETEAQTPLATGVQVIVTAISEDGSLVYAVSTAVLAPGASAGEDNLYALHESGGSWTTKLVARLSEVDGPDWGATGALGSLTARVSPDGTWLAFMSARSLTGYDNRDASSGQPDEEVYLYDAVSERLVCASCDPTGARPTGVEYQKLAKGGPVGGDRVWPPARWIAANVPGYTPYSTGEAIYQSRYLLDGGRLFFNSSDALVPQDSNGEEDVYEYEPAGVGGCSESSVTFSERANGCVGLISSGTAPRESGFLDASETGGDVFFLTYGRLAKQDIDTSIDVYDAHECTASSPCAPAPAEAAPECATAEECRGAPTPQPSVFGAPASATFSGLGNVALAATPPASPPQPTRGKPGPLTRAQKLARALKACARERSKGRRAACERRARKLYGPARPAAARAGARGKGRGR
jgi:hypothetical protein